MIQNKNFFFIGIAGTGMSRLALLLRQLGAKVAGSDRCCADSITHPQVVKLMEAKINLYPQDSTGINKEIDTVVTTPAIETDNPDLIKAKSLGLPITARSKLLADIFNQAKGIGISGTSGKTSTTGMVSTILRSAGETHLFYCGDDIIGPLPLEPSENFGSNTPFVAEIDESDGSPVYYKCHSLIITNISLDHKGLDEIINNFLIFCRNCSGNIILNADCAYFNDLKNNLPNDNILTFGIEKNADYKADSISLKRDGSVFFVKGEKFELNVPGIHNVYNALASIALLNKYGLPLDKTAAGLYEFKGIKRRFELVGYKNGIAVYDDYSHNPDKIYAALSTLKQSGDRVFFIFRPHGYGPMTLFRDQLVSAIRKALSNEDKVFFLDIYDAGGTANRSIHSKDIVGDLTDLGVDAHYAPSQNSLAEIIKKYVRHGDSIIIMGARDPYLNQYANILFNNVSR